MALMSGLSRPVRVAKGVSDVRRVRPCAVNVEMTSRTTLLNQLSANCNEEHTTNDEETHVLQGEHLGSKPDRLRVD